MGSHRGLLQAQDMRVLSLSCPVAGNLSGRTSACRYSGPVNGPPYQFRPLRGFRWQCNELWLLPRFEFRALPCLRFQI